MFLKSMEIRGFKSFADKTELVFKNGIMGIVGPNGSGKSNISDAVRWVLGEQSVKSLRGGKMEDVIFAGTQFRKPVGLCQVSLTLDNEDKKLPLDYAYITISRRLYRSGESEYYINNTQCRLKDIQQLFMDTGIGKEGYSIIGQGKIEAVLSGKPEERRSLLEEAAGIVKFKWRKEDAQKKLENTESNLVRIDDILETYSERLEPLRIENEKAKEFIKLSEELKIKEINIAAHSIEKVQCKLSEIENTINNMNVDNEELNRRCNEAKKSIGKWNEQIQAINLKSEDCKSEYYNSKSKKQNIESQTSLLHERLENLSQLIEKNFKELEIVKNKILNMNKIENEEITELESLKAEQKNLNNEINNYEKFIEKVNLSIYDKNDLVKKLKDDQIEYLSSIANSKNSLIMIKNDLDETKKKIQELKDSCNSYVHSITINQGTKETLVSEIETVKSKIEEFENNIKSNKQQINKINNNLGNKDREFKELNVLHNKLEANCHMLINLEKQYEGYNRAVKNLMQDVIKGKVAVEKDSCSVLGEVIDVKKEFETAIEIALGGTISDVITRNEEIAKKLIKHLKDNNMGRATFLPLNIVKGKKVAYEDRVSQVDGYIGIASKLIQYDKVFTNAIEYVIGRTIICRDMDSALKIAKEVGYSLKIVTLAGEVVNPGGALTGGSIYHKSVSIMGRKREIEETKIKIQSTEEKINLLSDEIQGLRTTLKSLDEQNLNLKDAVYHENIEITRIKGKISTIDSESLKIKENLKVSNNEIELLNKKANNMMKEIEEKQENLKVLSEKQLKNDDSIIEMEEKLKDKNKEVQVTKEKLVGLKIKKARVDENTANRTNTLQKLSEDLEELKQKRIHIEEEIKDSNENVFKCKSEIDSNGKEISKISEYILKKEEDIKELEVELIEAKEKLKISNEKMESINLLIGKKEDELHRMEVSSAKLTTEKEVLYKKLNEELQITYAEALEYKAEIKDIDAYKKDILTLKNSISSLGIINLGAIEEFKELTEKVNFMTTQRNDLINAKDELVSLINEMTDKMKVVFNENFNKLRHNFNETFIELFKGGNADLVLSNGDELTGNIEITVQPPGKKLQNINLMSGGEKGLSAIALLFAILKMKPTPFCILDEIEAALDDANVSRYAEFLKKFSGSTQFIVITHRKGTMEASDALYGVTMEEKGISKVVSVDLEKEAS
ncbi:chromosome segregation protein SMC [Clostridium carboxidivorans P7]|uniref:Chromosome partition protein Smc n=1 Tax=Clostridium carboxidivorans P7 TaxID=536227 RepID=C6PR03_9CLOT|nr:chromosome segregation protein SMC [Clostridium carboxidivorans]AKN29440.1 chromosome segregation protein SMC [Clostridium carboxidivorans P7]EET88367.1 chromosome segregation protein SMC [Clostridium carboxidivorans P7]EFG89641.1 chromosome segregation protein SMC [Clostridium carboxidivorans P7]